MRGNDVGARQHWVTLLGLVPETAYEFEIHSGSEVLSPISVTTAASTLPLPPFIVFGEVTEPSGKPAIGTLVIASLADNEGTQSEPISAFVDVSAFGP